MRQHLVNDLYHLLDIELIAEMHCITILRQHLKEHPRTLNICILFGTENGFVINILCFNHDIEFFFA